MARDEYEGMVMAEVVCSHCGEKAEVKFTQWYWNKMEDGMFEATGGNSFG